MFRRLIVLVIALTMTCGFGVTGIVVGGPTGAAAAGGSGVGPSQFGLTGTARACEAHAANNGTSYANGLQCGQGTTPSLTLTADCSTATFTITGSGLNVGDNVWGLDQTAPFPFWLELGPVASNGTFVVQESQILGFDTLTLATFAAGVDANAPGSSATFTAPPAAYNCLPASGTLVTTVSCQAGWVVFAGAGLPVGDNVWVNSQATGWFQISQVFTGSTDDGYVYLSYPLYVFGSADTITLAAFPDGLGPNTNSTPPDVTATPVTYSCP
jgi:hypothetical protein